jgi:hypothetical protein
VAVDSYYNESSVIGIEAYVYTISHSGYNLMVPLTKIINFNVQRMEENRIPKSVLYMNLESTRPKVDQEIDGKMK